MLTDIDSKPMQVNIQEGKGLKQRKVPLSPVLLSVLRRYYKKYKPRYYLFEGAGGKGTHLGITAVRTICTNARYRTPDIKKPYTPHTFRHSFAKHHLEQGTSLLVIQRLLGHSDLSNTLKYLHIQQLNTKQIINPLDTANPAQLISGLRTISPVCVVILTSFNDGLLRIDFIDFSTPGDRISNGIICPGDGTGLLILL